MPKKSRTPPPPRRPQGPRKRADVRSPADTERRNRMILYGVAGSGLIGLLVVIGVIAFGGGGGGGPNAKSVAATMTKAGCTFKTYPEQPRAPHYTSLTPKKPMKYNSFPPTSGRHYYAPVIFGLYPEPVDELQAVHNLEHGAVIVQWGNKVPKSDVQKIEAWYQDDANAILAAPLPKLGNKIALTAWTRLAECRHFDETAFSKFRDAFRYHAPEHFPKDQLNPGM